MDAPTQADLAMTARRGGRAITERLAKLLHERDAGHYWLDMRAVLSGETRNAVGEYLDPGYTDGVLSHLWRTHLGGDRAAMAALARPDTHELGRRGPRGTLLTLAQAEAMTTWPIIAAAYGMSQRDLAALTASPRSGIEQYQAEGR